MGDESARERHALKTFVCRALIALLPVMAFVVLYLAIDPFKVVHPYDGISVAPGDSLERIPNKRYVAVEGLKYYNGTQHYNSFIFGSSISSNFTVEAWKKYLPADASVYHFTAGSETLVGIRDELRYLFDHQVPVEHALLVMEEELFRRPTRYNEMPFVPHYDVSPDVTWLDFQRAHFNAFRDPDMFVYSFFPSLVVNKLVEEGKLQPVTNGGRDELTNEDSSRGIDSLVLNNPGEYYGARPWVVNMSPYPNPLPLSIDATAEKLLREIADMLQTHHVDYLVIVPPRFRSEALLPLDHVLLCEIMGRDRVHDFSGDKALVHDLYTYYDGTHLLTHRCTELIDRSYAHDDKWLTMPR